MKIISNSLHHFAFFRNKEVDALYVTLALIQFAESLAGIFVPIYLWNLGYPFWKILFFFLIKSVFFIIIMMSSLFLIKKLSDKFLMMTSIPFLILYFFGLKFIDQIPSFFYILPILHSASIFLFNTGYHISFGSASDTDSLGKEIGARYLISSLVTLSAPFLGGLLIALVGFSGVFTLSASLLFLSVLPLFYFPKRMISADISQKSIWRYLWLKPIAPFTLSGIGYAAETMVGVIIWPIFMFTIFGSIKEIGGIISIGLLAGAIVTFLIGFLSDAGRRRRIIIWSSFLSALIWFSRLFYASPLAIASSQIVGHTISSALMVGWSSQYYKIARVLPSLSSFILSRELLYSIVRAPFILLLMILSAYLPLHSFFWLTFILAALSSLLFPAANKVHSTALQALFKNR